MVRSATVDETTEPPRDLTQSGAGPGVGEAHALVLIWSRAEPARVGEVLLIPQGAPGAGWTFGRNEARAAGRGASLSLVRQRPGAEEPAGPLASTRISRTQLRLEIGPRGGLV